MKALYRTNFEVRAKLPPAELLNSLANVCWDWLFQPKRGYPVPSPRPTGCVTMPQFGSPPDAHAEAVALTHNGATRWALRLTHPHRDDPAVIWRTELGIEHTTDGRVFFSCSLYIGRTDKSLAPFRQPVSRPRIVLDILKQFQGYGALPLSSKPLLLKPDQRYIDALLALLKDARRQHPVVYVSLHNQSARFLFDVARLAEQLAGTAYVVVAESDQAGRLLQNSLPAQLQAFDGAVRIYWPGFTLNANPFAHPLWTKHRIISFQTRGRDAFSKKLLADIAAVSTTSVPDTLLTWSKIEEANRHHAIAEAKAARNEAALLQLFEEDNETLRVRVAGLERELQDKGAELYRALARIAALENASDQPEKEPACLPVETVADAIEQASLRWANELVYQPNNKSEGDESPFENAPEVLRAFEWLATVYHPSRLGNLKCPNLDASIREFIPGWSYTARQSVTALGRFKEWYQCQWDGNTYDITEHIGTGTSTRPEQTIRIAFAWDKSRKKIVVGYIGQHQKNTKS